jgi:imidazolonepropionase-like amidohydrolase
VQSEIVALLKLAQELNFTVQTFTHILDGYKVAPEMAKAGTTASTFSDWWAYKFEVYDAIPHNACILSDAGIITSINSDSEDLIRRLNQEAAKSIYYCDMSAEDALKMVTINPAIQLNIDHKVGSIEVGKEADIVLWDQAPMSAYAKVLTTWIQGVPYFDRQQDLAERERIKKERNALIQKLIADDSPPEPGEIPPPSGTTQWHCDSLTHFHNNQLHLKRHGGH